MSDAQDAEPPDRMLTQLTSQDQLDALLATSGPVWLFKHSSACGVSAAALDQIGNYLAAHPGEAAGMVVVQESRPLSTAISGQLRYVHQSPQLFLLRDGVVVWSASHWAITTSAMTQAAGRT